MIAPVIGERVMQLAREALPWTAFAGLLGLAAWGHIGPDLQELLVNWGPGLLIFLVVSQYVPALVRAQERQATAMMTLAQDLRELPRKDDLKFQDLSIGQELILKQLREFEERLGEALHKVERTDGRR